MAKIAKSISMETNTASRLDSLAQKLGFNPSNLATKYIEIGLNKDYDAFPIHCECGEKWLSNLNQCPKCGLSILKAICKGLDKKDVVKG